MTNLQLMSTQLACHVCTSVYLSATWDNHRCQVGLCSYEYKEEDALTLHVKIHGRSHSQCFIVTEEIQKKLSRLSFLTAQTVERCLKICVIFIFESDFDGAS